MPDGIGKKRNQLMKGLIMNQNKTIKCAYCGKVIVDDFFALEIDGEHYCSHSCAYDAGYEKCEFCGEWTHFDFAISIFIDDNYCGSFCDNDCAEHAGYSECNQCGEWHLADSMYSVDNYELCQSCFFEIARTCDNCGEAHLPEEAEKVSSMPWDIALDAVYQVY